MCDPQLACKREFGIWVEAVCRCVSGLHEEQWLLAGMESARILPLSWAIFKDLNPGRGLGCVV